MNHIGKTLKFDSLCLSKHRSNAEKYQEITGHNQKKKDNFFSSTLQFLATLIFIHFKDELCSFFKLKTVANGRLFWYYLKCLRVKIFRGCLIEARPYVYQGWVSGEGRGVLTSFSTLLSRFS